jgi:hypothetical protein
MHDTYQISQKLSDGTYISVIAPGQQMAHTAFEYLRTVVRATRPEVQEQEPPETKADLISRLGWY